MRTAIHRFHGSLICVIVVLISQSMASAQDESIRAVNQGVARELAADTAAEVLQVPEEFIDELRSGGFGLVGGKEPKDRLAPEQLETFANQFGRLQNDLPTFQIGPGRYFVLIPLADLDRQPPAALRQAERGDEEERIAPEDSDATTAPADGDALPEMVDHRADQTPVRDQGDRGTCVAFASCAELEAILRRDGEPQPDLSENFAYDRYMIEEGSLPCDDPGLATWRAAGYLQTHLICEESLWSYVGTDTPTLKAQGHCDQVNDEPTEIDGKPGVGIGEFVLLPKSDEVTADGSIDIKDTRTIERLLDEDRDIVFGTIVAWNSSDTSGIIDVKLGPAGQPIFGAGGHAMLIVGYDRRTGRDDGDDRPYFIAKNSWGDDYGHDGYLYLTYDYIRTYARYGYATTSIRRAMIDLTP